MDNKKLPNIREVSVALGLNKAYASRWLTAAGLPDEKTRNKNAFSLPHPLCVALFFCKRLFEIRALGFNDPGILAVFALILKGEDRDLRAATVALLPKPNRRIALTAAPDLVARHTGDEVTWETEDAVRAWAFDGTLGLIALQPLYESVDRLFAELNDEEEGKVEAAVKNAG